MVTRERKQLQAENLASTDSSGNIIFNERMQGKLFELVQNEMLSRSAFLTRLMDPRRDYNRECGYPESYELSADKYQEYFERNAVACRVVELYPTECWQISPELIEDDDPNIETPFELAFKNLARDLRGGSLFEQKDEAHPVWEFCKRADIQSGIAQYGVILLGFDDGLALREPVEGWQEPNAQGLTWNVDRRTDEEKPGNFPSNGKKKKKSIAYSNGVPMQAPTGTSMPSAQAFGNIDPQQSKYRNPLVKHPPTKTEGQQPNVSDQLEGTLPEYEELTAEDTRKPASVTSDPNAPNEEQDEELQQDPSAQQREDIEAPIEEQDVEDQDVEQEEPIEEGAEEGIEGQQDGIMPKEEAPQGRRLLYMRVFPESLVTIIQYEQNMASPRFGQPTLYRITLNDPSQRHQGIGLPLSTVEVHYSRVIHLADNLASSEIFGVSRMRPVLNHLIDLQKIYSASGEGYWKNAFATLAAETHPQLGGDVTIDTTAIREQMKKWRDSLDRVLAATGVTWKTIAPQVVDPNSHVQNQITAICIKLGCPTRVFMGSEIGQLAAGQDAVAWRDRLRERRKNYITPRIIVPLVDRLIALGVLPAPKSYSVTWDDEQKLTPAEQASVAGALTGAMAGYISGQCDQFMEPISYLVNIWGWSQDRAQAVIDATLQHIQQQQEQQAMAGQQAIDPMTGQPLEQDPETGQYMDPNTGEPLQTDEFGKPMMVNPETGEPMPIQMQSAQEQQGPLGAEAAAMQQEQQGQVDPETGEPLQEQPVDEEGNPLPQEEQEVDEEGNPIVPQEEQELDKDGSPIEPEGEDTEQPTDEEGEEAAPPQAGEAEGEVDEETGLPIDPNTGYLVHESGYLIDKESGDVYNPQTGEVVGNINDEAEQDEEPQE